MQIAGSRTLRRRKSRMTTLKPSAVAISGSRSLYSSVIVGIVLQIALEKPAPNRRVTTDVSLIWGAGYSAKIAKRNLEEVTF